MRKKEGNRNSTPSPTWKFGCIQPDGTLIEDFNFTTNSKTLSARKLGSNLWEMNKNGLNLNHHHHHKEEKNFEVPKKMIGKTAQRHSEKPKRSIKVRNRIAASMGQEKAQQPLSPASFCSSMEMASHGCVISPSSSLGSEGKFGKSSHGLKTSTELLKVLNRIWSLEEKHALDMSLVKTLRRELDQSQAQFKELLQEKKRDQKEINNLAKQITEYKVTRKKEKLIEEKLEAEVKLRRNSEKLHQKLAQELLEMKKSFSNALKELERERKARILLEDLCDEFAKGIRDYEQELRFIKQQCRSDQIGKESDDRLLLHISEAWLDERMQMKLADHDVSDEQTVLNKLCFEIEAFLRAKRSEKNDYTHSLESFHLNEPASAPWNDENDSISFGNKKSRRRNSLQGARTRNPSLTLEDKKLQYENDCMEGSFDPSTFAGTPSPVKKWTSEVYAEDPEISESSGRWGQSLKPNTLKAKLMEARLERQQSRPRTSKATFRYLVQLHKDVPKAARFYSEGLGFTIDVCTLRWAELHSGPLKLALLNSPSGHVEHKGYSSLLSFTVTDINSTVAKLMALGAELDGPIKYEIHGKVAAMRCADDHVLGLHEPT
ncbi:hypothetical protein BUALT_Bualt01G0235100 [Buddleja alternifolia]|uniref:Glyoxalase/fosfomycin resistance/dioxygenase domain-containing protein n=1 Tax=Buddleja alternifolia TaxID=168488 RepID=A0AAV6YK06_9LAMI|nr:hypothetical protein BUALT_Bualt01G0235100 [Buddleja alternifolia]